MSRATRKVVCLRAPRCAPRFYAFVGPRRRPGQTPSLHRRFAVHPHLGLRASDAGWTGSMFVGGQGFNSDRARLPDPGFRLPAARLPASSLAPSSSDRPPIRRASRRPGPFVGYRRDNWTLTSGVRQGLGEWAGGTRLDLGASYGFNVNPRHLITLSGGLTLGASAPLAPYYAAYGDGRTPSGGRAIGPASRAPACGSPGGTPSTAAPPISPRRSATTARTGMPRACRAPTATRPPSAPPSATAGSGVARAATAAGYFFFFGM